MAAVIVMKLLSVTLAGSTGKHGSRLPRLTYSVEAGFKGTCSQRDPGRMCPGFFTPNVKITMFLLLWNSLC